MGQWQLDNHLDEAAPDAHKPTASVFDVDEVRGVIVDQEGVADFSVVYQPGSGDKVPLPCRGTNVGGVNSARSPRLVPKEEALVVRMKVPPVIRVRWWSL